LLGYPLCYLKTINTPHSWDTCYLKTLKMISRHASRASRTHSWDTYYLKTLKIISRHASRASRTHSWDTYYLKTLKIISRHASRATRTHSWDTYYLKTLKIISRHASRASRTSLRCTFEIQVDLKVEYFVKTDSGYPKKVGVKTRPETAMGQLFLFVEILLGGKRIESEAGKFGTEK